MKASGEISSDEVPLYNIRILRSYIDYVRKNYPNINVDKILEYAGVTKLQYNDFGYWCNQRQMNRLQEILLKKTGNRNISRETGRDLINSQNIFALYVLGFISPTNIASQIARVYNKLSRAADVRVKSLGVRKCEVLVTPHPEVNEEFYQCLNRIGSIEGLLKYFLYEYPSIEHPECYHEGATRCRYILSWEKLNNIQNWIKIRNYTILVGTIISVITYHFLSINYTLLAAFSSFSVVMFLTQQAYRLEINKVQKDFSEVNKTAEDYLNELNIRYNLSKLVQEVGELTSVRQIKEEISASVSAVMNERLDYDRGAILLADKDRRTLVFVGGYGFKKDELNMFKKVQFRLVGTADEYIFQKVFMKQEPVLIEDINEYVSDLDADTRNILNDLKINSMACVPIIHEGESLGVMAVDSSTLHYEFREGDINLLMAVASQTALSIANAGAYQKLQESEKKHRTLVETIRDIVYTIDLEGRFTYVSPIIEVITGFTSSELVGSSFMEIVSPEYRDLVMQRFKEGLQSRETTTYEIDILTRDKRTVPIELNAAPLTDNMGQSIGRIGVARDITRRKMEEAERQDMEVKALTQDKLASLGEIAAGVAHELNQPLSYIKVILQSTLNDLDEDRLNKSELSEDFNESLRQVGKISNIITHLRTFGRSDVSVFGPVKISSVIDDTLILMRERLRVKNISLNVQLDEDLSLIYGNQVKLEQVFLNLIQNSMDALEEEGRGEIILRAEADKDEILIVYSDSGKGVDPELQEKVFEPFFTTKEPGKGTGIGLSIVYGIIQEHKGSIACESAQGQGAIFRIKLPVYSEEKANVAVSLHA